VDKYLSELINSGGSLTLEDVFMRIVFSMIMGLVVYISYRMTHMGSVYSKKFNITLYSLTVLTATVMTVIGNNIALSLGMVGALSIIRFRTSIKDSRDTIYIFWTIIIGICSGVGDFLVGTIGSAAVFIVLLIFGNVKNNERVLLIIRADRSKDNEIRSVVFHYFEKAPQLKVHDTTELKSEFIYELTKEMIEKANKNEINKAIKENRENKEITDYLYEVGNIDYVNIVMQNDEIV